MHDETKIVTAGRHPRAHFGAVNPPVYHTSTILFDSFDAFQNAAHEPENSRFAYGRLGTPTTTALEEAVATLEGGSHCRLAPSGLAAITTALTAFLAAGDHLLAPRSAYGPTRNFCATILKRFGVETTLYEPCIGAEIATLIRPNTRIVYTESPTSGLFEVQDIPAIAAAAHARGATVIMDNTWASPLYFKPFAHGVDVSIQAATKYIVGHSDAMLGTITCTEESWPRLRDAHRQLGQTAGPDDAYLGQRGLRTIAVRMAQHHQNGLALARYLAARPEVAQVMHPALEGDPGYALWRRDYLGASGLFSFIMRAQHSEAAIAAMLDGLALFGMGYSWGGYESLIAPVKIRRFRPDWPEDTWAMRIHAGLEHPDDLIADLDAGFARLRAAG